MKHYTIILLLCGAFIAEAQTNFVGIKTGYISSMIVETREHPEGRKGFVGGLTLEHKFKSKITVGADLMYAQKGFTDYFIFGSNLSKEETVSFNYDYLGIPLKVGYNGGRRFGYFVNVGFCTALLIGESRNYSYFDLKNYNYDTRSVEFSGILELGMGYELSERITLNAILAVQQSLTPIGKPNSIFMGDEITLRTDMALLGIKYKLGK